ncbi:MAG: Asp23/Gls24 family envelope stress response protein [Tissierellia bacterium]|nr:Asp23/Gls24 family envelope stress response protein [Tissierellia bacterium]
MSENNIIDNLENGAVEISEDVIATIAGIEASQIEGVASLSGSMAGEMIEMLGVKNKGKGVEVNIEDRNVYVSMHLNVLYGVNITEIGKKTQIRVKEAIENMTALNVQEINVFIAGVVVNKKKKESAE